MAENTKNLDLGGLREEISDPVKFFSEQVITSFGDNLESITIFGSSLTNDYTAGKSDINTVLVLKTQTIDSLNTIADMAKAMQKKAIAVPVLMTPAYIETSMDVFGIEFLDFQLNHNTIYGNDPFGSLTILKSDVRLQCERELKAMLIRLRQGYIAAGANKRLVRDILISTAAGLLPLLRAILWLKDIEREILAEDVFAKAGSEFNFSPDSLIEANSWKHSKASQQKGEIESIFESVYSKVEQLASTVDGLEV